MLVLGSMPGLGIREDLQRGELLVQRIPVLDRERDVVVAADVQDRNGSRRQGSQNGVGREDRVLRLVPEEPHGESTGTGSLRSVTRPAMRSCERFAASRLERRSSLTA
jgi:hypothetical protein